MKKINIKTSTEYNILIGEGLRKDIGDVIVSYCDIKSQISLPRIAVISDDIVFGLYGGEISDALKQAGFGTDNFVFEHGESSKNLKTYGEILNFLCNKGYTRSDMVLALGGGVVGDISGFASATYQRGIRYIQVPTTLLAMVDSSVGGKTAVNLAAGKNQVGCFYQPSLVICDPDFLNSLPEEQYCSGCAEIIKYAVLKSRELYDKLMEKDVRDQYESVIETCVSIKKDYVLNDEFDRGLRMKLNLGHSIGHAIEALSGFSLLHGEGVAIGMAMIAEASFRNGFCNERCRNEIISILKKYKLPTNIKYVAVINNLLNDSDISGKIIKLMKNDKKLSDDKLRLIVPIEIGKCEIVSVCLEKMTEWV